MLFDSRSEGSECESALDDASDTMCSALVQGRVAKSVSYAHDKGRAVQVDSFETRVESAYGFSA